MTFPRTVVRADSEEKIIVPWRSNTPGSLMMLPSMRVPMGCSPPLPSGPEASGGSVRLQFAFKHGDVLPPASTVIATRFVEGVGEALAMSVRLTSDDGVRADLVELAPQHGRSPRVAVEQYALTIHAADAAAVDGHAFGAVRGHGRGVHKSPVAA